MIPDKLPDREIAPQQEAQDVMGFLDQFHDELPNFSSRVGAVPAGEVGSIEWARGTAKYWRGIREDQGLNRYRVASQLGIPVNELRLFEVGLRPDLMQGEFPLRYAQALSRPETYEQFCQQFGVQPFAPPEGSQ